MLTPVDISNRVFKGGIGYDKKDVENFMSELSSDYKDLYSSNIELKDKIATLNESLQHYRSIEDSMQKALTLSEKTAEETVNAANDKARQITNEAEIKAESILINAKAELQSTKDEIFLLQQQFNTFKQQINKLLDMQKKLIDGEVVEINLGNDYEPSVKEYGGYFGSFGNDSSLGGLGGGLGSGTYVGSNDNAGRERANQEPAFDRGSSLNMDPFADAANGGGRFSRQTGGAYTGAKKNANRQGTGESLNMKKTNNKVKRPVTTNVMNSTVNPAATSDNTTKTQQSTTANSTQSVTKDVLEAINAVKKVVEQTANTANEASSKQTANNTEYVLYTEENSANKFTTSVETKATPRPEPVAVSNVTPKTEPIVETIATPKPESVAESNTTTKSKPSVVGNTESTLSGEVEDKVNEAHMLDSDDNHEEGFDFISDDSSMDSVDNNIEYAEEAYMGDIEDKINKANMLDSEDNHAQGFDFFTDEADQNSIDSNIENEEDTYFGEVEDKVNEAHMLDSEDNYDDEFNFIVDDSIEEEIPTIFTSTVNMDSFNMNKTDADNDILVGDVEDKAKPSNLIGNTDDDNEGFNFI